MESARVRSKINDDVDLMIVSPKSRFVFVVWRSQHEPRSGRSPSVPFSRTQKLLLSSTLDSLLKADRFLALYCMRLVMDSVPVARERDWESEGQMGSSGHRLHLCVVWGELQ